MMPPNHAAANPAIALRLQCGQIMDNATADVHSSEVSIAT